MQHRCQTKFRKGFARECVAVLQPPPPSLARDRQGAPSRSTQVDVKVPGQRTDRRSRPGPRQVGGSRNRKRWQSRRIEVEPRGQRAQPWQTPLTGEQASPVAIAKRDAASPIEDTLDRPQHTCFDDDRVDGSVAGCVEPPVRESAHCEFARPQIEGQAWVCERASDRSGQLDSATSGRGAVPPLSQLTQVDCAAVFQIVAAALAKHESAVESKIAAVGFGDERSNDQRLAADRHICGHTVEHPCDTFGFQSDAAVGVDLADQPPLHVTPQRRRQSLHREAKRRGRRHRRVEIDDVETAHSDDWP